MTTFPEIQASYPSLFPENFAFECGQGWTDIVGRYLATVAHMLDGTGSKVLVVREKMGALRIEDDYPEPHWGAYSRPKMLAEFRSRLTCEECGAAGHMRKTNGLYRCRCDEHATAEERTQPARPSWTIGRLTTEGFLWYDPAIDDVRIVGDLSTTGMPPEQIERMKQEIRE
ncbi:hypothetical protein [Agrobacterium tumefaciens]|uniref:hypothetical protein n=1 Tax=Agrobacterium tumefaciens TaxID=358 RepID=UPI0015722DB2|nr:hypothetical protein [Agrobacterium tumefaciens]